MYGPLLLVDHAARRPARGLLVQGVVEAAQQLAGAGGGLFAVVGQEQAAVLPPGRAYVRQPAQPGPLGAPLLHRPRPVGGDQDQVEPVRRVQGGELGEHGTGQPRQPWPGTGEPERTGLQQADGDRHRLERARAGTGGTVGGAQAHGERLGVALRPLPQARARTERGQQQGGRVRPGVGQAGGGHGRGRRFRHGRAGGTGRGEAPGPGPEAAPPAGRFLLRPVRLLTGVGGRGGGRSLLGRGEGDTGPGVGGGDAEAALPVGGGRHGGRRLVGQAQPGLADAQQGARGQPDRLAADRLAVHRGAVGRVEVGDEHPAVGTHGDGAMGPGDVRVVQGDVGVVGPADPGAAAVQQVDAARVRPGDHVQPRTGVRRDRSGPGTVQREDGAVDQRRVAEQGALAVEPVPARVQHDGPLARLRRLREGTGDRRERGAGGSGDQDVAAVGGGRAAGRSEDGQPDLHRGQRSLLRRDGGRLASPNTRHSPARRPVHRRHPVTCR